VNLRTRFLLLISALIVVGSVSAWAVFHHLARQIVMQWGQRVADIQVRYDRARLLQPLEREIALVKVAGTGEKRIEALAKFAGGRVEMPEAPAPAPSPTRRGPWG